MNWTHLKNRLIFCLVRRLKPKTVQRSAQRHFLIVSTTGLGDTLWATPALKTLRLSFPNALMTVLTSPMGFQVLQHNPHIDHFLVVKDPVFLSLPRLYFRLKRKQISDVLLFHASQRSLLPLTAVLGATRVIGTAGINKGLDALLTTPLEPLRMHEIQRRLHIVHAAGAHYGDPQLELFLSPQDEQEAQNYLSSLKIPSHVPKISLHPGAKDLFKQWPPSHFVTLGKRLIERLGCQLFITGTPAETSLVLNIAKQIPGAIPLTHLRLRPFAAFLKQMRVTIANDTGPMHVAFAMKTPTVALFTPTEPDLCGPYFVQNTRLIEKKKTCTPCLRKRCKAPFCLLQISVDEVFSAVAHLYSRSET